MVAPFALDADFGDYKSVQALATPEGDEQTVDVCANNGGLQWQGEVCVCAGFVDLVTVCNNGTKFDNVTDQPCSPDPASCQDQGDGGGKAACINSCGNGVCDP
jgi:hypothetical protein